MKRLIPLLSFFIFPDIDFNFQQPSGIGVDKDGMVYVVSSGNSQIRRYSKNGRLNLVFGERGEDEGCLDGPMDVAINSKGEIFVSDTWNNRICVFSSEGIFKREIGGLGEGLGRFKYPLSIAIDKDDCLYVVDRGNALIQKFDPKGQFIMEFGKREGLKLPYSIAIEGDNIYISDSGNNRIMRFSQEGNFISSIRGIDKPGAIAIGPDKNLYVADGRSWIMRLEDNEFSPFIKELSNPSDIAFSDKELWVAECGRNRVLKFSLSGVFEEEWTSSGSSLERLNLPYDVACSNGNIYIADCGNNRILCLDLSFKPKRLWEVPSPIALFVSNEDIYCVSSRENTIIKFDKAGNELLRLPNLVSPRDVVVDSKGVIFVLTSSEVLRFSQEGRLLGTICSLLDPSCLALDNLGFILISDANTIKRFSSSGVLIKTIEGISSAAGIVVDQDNNIYVAERGKNRILRLDFYGRITEVINNPKLLYPYGLSLDRDGNLYIADCGNHRMIILGKGERFKMIKEMPIKNLAELVVSEIEVLEPKLGIWTRLSARIENQGNIKADFISVNFFCSSNKIGFGKIIKNLPPKESITVNTIWLPEESGTQTLRVVVDQEDKIKEDNEENNTKEKDIFVY